MLRKLLALTLAWAFVHTPQALAEEADLLFQSSDGFELPAKIAYPENQGKDPVKKVVILIHGSGPNNMDEDLTSVTRDKQKNLHFKDISDALIKQGFTVIRYDKRSFVWNQKIKKNPDLLQSPELEAFKKNLLNLLVQDAAAFTKMAARRFPEANIYLYGHSQGTFIALQTAHTHPQVKGVALEGFYGSPLMAVMLEQFIYRYMPVLRTIDTNQDEVLSDQELENIKNPLFVSLKQQKPVLDVNQDGRLTLMEVMAGNYTQYQAQYLNPHSDMSSYTAQEASYPPPVKILQQADFKVAFFQGEWDNQTPVYNTQSIQLMNRMSWKKDNLRFWYFPQLGHALDLRDSYLDIVYSPIKPEALRTVAKELGKWFD